MRRVVAAAVAVLFAVGFTPGVARAATGLGDGQVRVARVAQDYTYRTFRPGWSVVAVQPDVTADWDLTLRDGGGTALASSLLGTGRTDFVAVDSNVGRRPLGAYTAAVTQYRPGVHWVQQHTGVDTLTLPPVTHHGTTGAGDPDLAFVSLPEDEVVAIAEVQLSAGESFWAHTTTAAASLYLVESDPATFVLGRATAAARQQTQVLDGCTRYTAQRTGRHALVLAGDRPLTAHTPPQGTAYALHRIDPSTPAACPLRNFPAPTP